MPCFKEELEGSLDIMYDGDGHEMARRFYIPVLRLSKEYDRVSGYFSVDSLVVVAAGLAGLIGNRGSVRLVVGVHDIGPDLRKAYLLSRDQAEMLLSEIGDRIASGLERVEDLFARRRLEALAWMLAEGLLEIRVAVPKRTFIGLGNGIFHEKVLLFYDGDGCIVGAAGSANETRMAWEENGENLTVHMSWREGHQEYLNRYRDRFEALWSGVHPDYFIFTLPEAVEKRLKERFYPERPPERDPVEEMAIRRRIPDIEACGRLVPAARLVMEVGRLKGLAHLGLGPVRLYPHQVFAVDFVLSRFPYRALVADEVGLGKTIEVGGVIKRLVDTGRAERVLVLAPKNVSRQWQEELWFHFALPFWRLETGPKRLVHPTGEVVRLGDSNPFDRPGVDFLVASWHYARGSRRRPSELLKASRFYDLIVVDEAHAARRTRSIGGVRPTLLNQLCMELSITSPHLLLVTATPVQLNVLEAWDLLRILGLGGPWVHEESFERFYKLLSGDSEDPEDWASAFRLAAWVGRNYMTEAELGNIAHRVLPSPEDAMEVVREVLRDGDGERLTSRLLHKDRRLLRSLLLALSPVQWFMVRNSRERLLEAGYSFPERDVAEVPVELDPSHKRLLDSLDDYLRFEYGLYERLLSETNRGVFGFVRSVYHQRFVSCFTASYQTILNREAFLEAVLRDDKEALLRVASRLLKDVDWEGDEEDIVEAARELLDTTEGRTAVVKELERVRQLRDELSPYAPEVLSGDDPKLRQLRDEIDRLVAEGRGVLVFSKYTDTVDAVVRFIGRESRRLTRSQIGVYTGAGGQLYSLDKNRYVGVGKEDVRAALEDGRISVLVCSEAAAEGLNLQAASAVVNVDMPWNPARVEQRIGRADRLGQKAERVVVRNVWYPDSIEAEMYRRLFERKETYRLVVGPAQAIVSEGLRRALDEEASGAQLRRLVDETIRQIDAVKEEAAATGGVLSGTSWGGGRTFDEGVVERLASFGVRAAEALGLEARVEDGQFILEESSRVPEEFQAWNGTSLEVGSANALTAAHPIIRWLAQAVLAVGGGREPGVDKSVYVVRNHDGLGELLVLEEEGGAPIRLDTVEKVESLFDEFLRLGDR
mgnify:CR=1 FL=1